MAVRPILAAVGVLLALAPASASASRATTAQIVVYKDVSNPSAETQTRERDLGFTATQRYRRVVEGFAARLTAQQIESLRQDPEVAQVVPDRPVHADSVPLVAGGSLPFGISRVWAQSGGSIRAAAGVAVAVVDTGIDLPNPDLNVDPALPGKNCISNDPPQDEHGHGTHVAGTIAARNDGSGVVGVAPGTRLYSVKVLNKSGSGTVSTIICGLDWVKQNAVALGIKVVNMSLGGAGPVGSCGSDPEHSAICQLVAAGVTVVAAAGNDGEPLSSGSSSHVPGAYPEVLTVTAMADTDGLPGGAGPPCGSDADDGSASFSNFGSASEAGHIIAAPGDCVVSLRIPANGGGLTTMSGTSMATPHVVGAAALCIAEGATPGPCSGLPPAGVISRLRAIAQAGAMATNGFNGDPLHSNGRYFGYLARAAVPPIATTGDATPDEIQATLAGNVDSYGSASTWWFELGPTTAYGQSTPEQAIPAGPGPVPVQGVATGLDPGTKYHYRLVVHVGEWTVRGADRTVTTTGTPPPPPPETQIDVAPATRTTSGYAELWFSALPAAGATFECRLDTAAWSSCPSPRYIKSEVGEGVHTFFVRAIGPGGKTDQTPASVTWTVDQTPPDTLIAGAPANPTTSTSAAFGINSNESPVTLQCRLDGSDWVGCSAPWSITGLTAGAHRFEARAIDDVGWIDPTPAVYEWSVAGPAAGPDATLPSSAPETFGPAPLVTTGPGQDLLPVSRLATTGALRLDRAHSRVEVLIVCRGPGPCAGQLDIAIRGRRVASGKIQLAAGARKRIRLRLAGGSRRAVRSPTPGKASLSLIRGSRTRLEKSSIRLLTGSVSRG
jgi:subtilisin family serine protease